MNLQPTLSNNSISIRPIKEDDFDALYKIASDKLLWEQHPNKDRYKKEVFQDFFKKAIESESAFVVLPVDSNSIIGSTRFYNLDLENSSVVIGYTFIDRKLWGKSYNSNLKKLMLNYAFQFVTKVHFHVGNTNFRSQKAVEKLKAIKIGEILGDSSSQTNWIYELSK